MGQAVKFAFIGAAIITILGVIGALIGEFVPSSIFGTFNSALGSVLGTVGGYLMNVKGAINYFLGSTPYIVVFNFLITFSLTFEIAIIPAKAIIAVYHWLAK